MKNRAIPPSYLVTMYVTKTPQNEPQGLGQADIAWPHRPSPGREVIDSIHTEEAAD